MLRAAIVVCCLAVCGFGCSPFGGASVFNCDTNSQCTPDGRCFGGLCVFPSTTCASGEAYGPHSGSQSNTCVGDEPPLPDAPPDEAPPMTCTANAQQCFGSILATCNATGTGLDMTKNVLCPLTCIGGTTNPQCVAATNIAVGDQMNCNMGGNAPALAPPAGATITFNVDTISCAPNCGGAVTTIARTSATPYNFYCLSAITIPAGGVTIAYGQGAQAPLLPVALFSTSAVAINANLAFNGGNAAGSIDANTNNDVAGGGGPGGGAGGALDTNQNSDGDPGIVALGGTGTCVGLEGVGVNTQGNRSGGGGGGGANAGQGGDGGNGRDVVNAQANGGNGGNQNNCSSQDARNTGFHGGSGGASGADGGCGGSDPCGWPGGGGGGAIQIVSRISIIGAATTVLSANGGNGYGDMTGTGGGGGGGAGGFLLLEAPTVTWPGPLQVNGGNGGRSDNAAAGGAGATGGATNGTNGTDQTTADNGGPGGGGGGGRIRINATGASCNGLTVSPNNACTSGTLRTTP